MSEIQIWPINVLYYYGFFFRNRRIISSCRKEQLTSLIDRLICIYKGFLGMSVTRLPDHYINEEDTWDSNHAKSVSELRTLCS
ncbi:hypothetical protein TNCV_162631 [Trichonephila clavipes]|nr:hypothetical protein TNCV_162631 [Trichonephila clavipes]